MTTIRELRKERNLTQVELSKIFEIDQTTVSKWELNKALPDSDMLIKLSEFFDVSIDYILGRSKFYYPDNLSPTAPALTDNERDLLEWFRGLPSEKARASFLSFIRSDSGIASKRN